MKLILEEFIIKIYEEKFFYEANKWATLNLSTVFYSDFKRRSSNSFVIYCSSVLSS